MTRRAGTLASLALAGTLSLVMLTGCSPAQEGMMGIARDADGTLIVVARTCEEPIREAVLRGPSVPQGENMKSSAITRWEIDRDVESLSMEWPLLGPGIEGIVASDPMEEIPTPYYLELIGYRGSSFNATGPAGFDAQALEALVVGEVLVPHFADGIMKNKVVRTGEFQEMASCEN